jgi:uncharacterized protein (TIGR02246 family)
MSSMNYLRNVLLTVAAGTAMQASPSPGTVPDLRTAAEDFLRNWDAAWNGHDAHSLASLHTSDAVTVNRFGSVVEGRDAIEQALAFLHNGPFNHIAFPAQRIQSLRQVAPETIILRTKWQNPVMNSDGSVDRGKFNDMIVTFVLIRKGGEWKASEVDLHNVEKMDLPFSAPEQKGKP